MSLRLAFGSEHSQLVRDDIRGYTFPDRDDDADGNWLTVWLEIDVEPLRGTYSALWRAEFITSFRRELEKLYESLEGDATFHPDWEGSLALKLHGDGIGHISVKGEACPDASIGPWLRFHLPDIDQTHLPQRDGPRGRDHPFSEGSARPQVGRLCRDTIRSEDLN
jgi:hypothetical protein